MKASLMSNPLLGVGARLAGYIRNDSPRALVRDAIRDLELGSQLVLFPEGTRTVQAPINRLTGSFATIAARAGAPIQLVVIETDSRFLSKGWPIWRRPRFPLHYRVRLIDRLSPQASREQIIEQTEQAFRRALLGETMPTPDLVPEV
ncbi:MAG: lysophospholipid acyltransferase family protein [Burkholderiaceae bacterium]